MTADKRRALGRGLDALLPAVGARTASGQSYGSNAVFSCPIDRLVAQKGQPRQRVDEARLEELARSLREHGLIEPLVVRRLGPSSDKMEIVAGERRWKAAQRAGLKELLVVVKDVSPKEAFELALVENLQREDLGPIEVAEAFEQMVREHGYTHEALGERVHKDRTTVTNALRLLKLPSRVRALVVEGKLTEGHARALLGAPDAASMESLADKAVRGRLSVRRTEALIRAAGRGSRSAPGAARAGGDARGGKSANVRDLEQRLTRRLGLRVEVRDEGNRGEVAIRYANLEELDRVIGVIGG
jgi:ParB family chromosome partitioning protein